MQGWRKELLESDLSFADWHGMGLPSEALADWCAHRVAPFMAASALNPSAGPLASHERLGPHAYTAGCHLQSRLHLLARGSIPAFRLTCINHLGCRGLGAAVLSLSNRNEEAWLILIVLQRVMLLL